MSLICQYRPPDGNIKSCIDYLKIVFQACKSEIWILGDFNVDFLDRSCDSRSKFNTLFTSCGLKQLMHSITRPNKKGGTCIDWVVTNSEFIKEYGVTIYKAMRERDAFMSLFRQTGYTLNLETAR